MKLALVHDWLNQIGGAEDVLTVLNAMYPASPVYTSIYAPDMMPASYRDWDIRTLWLDKMPGIHHRHQLYLPLYPYAWGQLQLHDYDVVISNKSGFCHGFNYGDDTLHICYCLAPTRYIWQLESYISREGLGKPVELALRPLVSWLKRWDYAAAQRVDYFIAISTEIQQRISTYYNRDSVIIYPPVDTLRFNVPIVEPEDYFLIVSRLIPYKRIDLAVQAATRLNLPLKIGGKGRDLDRLQAMAGPTVEFLGYVPDTELPELMAKCRAFIVPGLEDFCITPVQAQAAGRPVIAFGGGGTLDTVIPGVTGEHFREMTVDSLAEVMKSFAASRYDPAAMREHAAKFDNSVFITQVKAFVEQAYTTFAQNRGR